MATAVKRLMPAKSGIDLSHQSGFYIFLAQRFAAALAGVSMVALKQTGQFRFVIIALTALQQHITVPLETIGFQRRQYLAGRALNDAGGVDIFDAQQPLALLRLAMAVTCHCGDQRAKMQWPGRGRGKSANGGGLLF